MKTLSTLLLVTMSALIASCSSSTKNMKVYQEDNQTLAQQMQTTELSIQYLGVGGHIFRFRDSAIMTAPSITNPSFWLLGPFMPISADTDLIDRYLPDVSDVESILVGHAHYDHLMDVPYVMQTKALSSHVYGSATMAHTIAPAIENNRLHPLNDSMAILDEPGLWHYNLSLIHI